MRRLDGVGRWLMLAAVTAGLVIAGAGCGGRRVAETATRTPEKPYLIVSESGRQTYDFAPGTRRLEGEVNAALIRLGVAPLQAKVGERRGAGRIISGAVQVRWPSVSFSLHPERAGAAAAVNSPGANSVLRALADGAGRAGAQVLRQELSVNARRITLGFILRLSSVALRVPVMVVEVPTVGATPDAGEVPPQRKENVVPLTGSRAPEDGMPFGGAQPRRVVARTGAPRVAIVIDDWGYAWSGAPDMLNLPVPLTMAVIPFLPATHRAAEDGHTRGWEVLVHLPMQTQSPRLDRTAGMVRGGQSDEEVRTTVTADLAAVPWADGANNHMGSLATRDARVMRLTLEQARTRGFFFVDSRTTSGSVVGRVAHEMGLPYAENYLFLDNQDNVAAVRSMLRRLLRAAQVNGFAIGIGHVRRATAAAIRLELPNFQAAGVELVPVRDLVATDFSYASHRARPSPYEAGVGGTAGGFTKSLAKSPAKSSPKNVPGKVVKSPETLPRPAASAAEPAPAISVVSPPAPSVNAAPSTPESVNGPAGSAAGPDANMTDSTAQESSGLNPAQ